jgi:hypothetical protein
VNKMILAAALCLALAGRPAGGYADPLPQQLIGTWKLVSSVIEEIPSGETRDLFGANPIGYIVYGADGRMLILQVRSDRARPAGPVPTPAEAEALFRSLIGYGGTYTVERDKVTHHVDISWNESWSGTDQVRTFKFEGDRVILSTEPSLDPFHGKMSVRRLTWQKLK